jgi:simple sugar transport system ATP-binding protein
VATESAISVRGVSRTYGATRALIDVDVDVAAGEIRGLVGRNGAGKSTLVRMITGLETPDSGTVRFFGEEAPAASSPEAWRQIVGCVYQRPSVFTNMTVAENMFVGRYPQRGAGISWREMNDQARAVLQQWGVDVDPRTLLEDVPLEQRQMVQIAKALDSGTRIVLLDEPTVQLDGHAVERLFGKVRELRDRGVTFVLVSHFLKEIEQVCDSATVLRDGRILWTKQVEDLAPNELVEAMLAGQQQIVDPIGIDTASIAAIEAIRPALAVSGLTDKGGAFTDVDLEVRPGELLAIAGLGGSGKNALGEAIAGLTKPSAGTVEVLGSTVPLGSVGAAQTAGIAHVPADRHAAGFIPQLSVAENATMAIMPKLSRFGFFSPSAQKRVAKQLIDDVSLSPRRTDLEVEGLSGGNQQKVVIARALAAEPDVLVLISPTAGVDIAAKSTIYGLIREAVERDVAVVLISDDVEELLLAHRIAVMFGGRVTAELVNPDEEQIVREMEGIVAA